MLKRREQGPQTPAELGAIGLTEFKGDPVRVMDEFRRLPADAKDPVASWYKTFMDPTPVQDAKVYIQIADGLEARGSNQMLSASGHNVLLAAGVMMTAGFRRGDTSEAIAAEVRPLFATAAERFERAREHRDAEQIRVLGREDVTSKFVDIVRKIPVMNTDELRKISPFEK
jgi:hypothetical protein